MRAKPTRTNQGEPPGNGATVEEFPEHLRAQQASDDARRERQSDRPAMLS